MAGLVGRIDYGKLGLLLFMPWSVFALLRIGRMEASIRIFVSSAMERFCLALRGFAVIGSPSIRMTQRSIILSPAFPFLAGGRCNGAPLVGFGTDPRGCRWIGRRGCRTLCSVCLGDQWTFPYHPAFFQAPIWGGTCR